MGGLLMREEAVGEAIGHFPGKKGLTQQCGGVKTYQKEDRRGQWGS